LAQVAGEFSECNRSIAVGIGLASEFFQEVVGEEAVAMLETTDVTSGRELAG